ncbi:fructose bisphosphate aldolase [Desulfobulbus sp.]|uniref:fructose bisphosphate aldolase n=1 Tax=Desulfobulbus sp. TaxID=895 RepID=UPI00286F771A|nr:fructose bisphosphate aldolase [Desulfobulbus sp.]
MKNEQLRRMHEDAGFIAALDQSGGSTPKALAQYGIPESAFSGDAAMFDMVHAMRTRIMTCPAFNGEHILGAILFENTMDRLVEGQRTADYLWNKKRIIPFLKVDKGLEPLSDGVQLMKSIPDLDALLDRAAGRGIFGTKMRSVIKEANPSGIKAVVAQQFDVAKRIAAAGLVPIIEPETDIHSPDRQHAESLLKTAVEDHLAALGPEVKVMFKFSIAVEDNLYHQLTTDPHVVRIVALSGGYSQAEANQRLSRNKGIIASFSRALIEGLSAQQSDEAFNAKLDSSVKAIYAASAT